MIKTGSQTGEAEHVLPGGECVVRSGERVYLIANAVPGDTLLFQYKDKRRGALRGSLESIVTPSFNRINAECDVASQCGGCALQYVSESEQLIIKSEWVRQSFERCFDADTLWQPLIYFSQGKRRRVRWHIGQSKQYVFFGFRARGSHDVISSDHCLVTSCELEGLRIGIQLLLKQKPFQDIESIQAIHLHDGIHVIVESELLFDTNPFSSLTEMMNFPVQWWQRQHGITRPFIKPVQTFHDQIILNDRTIDIEVGPDDFIQGQKEGNQALIEQVIAWCQGAGFIVDLFSGIGNLSLPIAIETGARIVGAEVSVSSVRAANKNAKKLNLQAQYHPMNLFDKVNLELFSGADVLILDPPRKGAKYICQQMGHLLPSKIIMINCDTASGARDAQILKSFGYKLQILKVIDLFPYAGHVEAMSLWSR
ncbi:MAG: 23S rRNA methyltransferase [Mariprofundaceae bacterium]